MRSIFLQILFLMVLPNVRGGEIVLVSNGSSMYVVTITADGPPQEEHAANLFRYYVKQATGLNLPISASQDFKNRIYFKEDVSLPDGSFRISNLESNLLINGGKESGVINGAAYILKIFFSIDFLAAGSVNVPITNKVSIKTPISILQSPAFKMRTIHSVEGYYQDYLETHTLQTPFKDSIVFQNTFNSDFLPPQLYYKSHPEYYSLLADRRDTAQPDLLQPKIAELVTQKIRNVLTQNANKKAVYYNLFLNDNPVINEDVKTQQTINRYGGSYSAVYLDFVNKIADSYSQQKFMAIAYEQTKEVPQNIVLRKNVRMVLTNADNNKSKSIQQDDYDIQQHLHMKTLLPLWLAKDPNLIYWDYLANYTNSLMPWPNLYTIKPNLQFYKSVGVMNLFLQLGGLFSSENSELKAYLCSSLMWNTEYNDDSLIHDFCMRFYQASGKVMYQYLSEINKLAFLGKETMYTYDSPEKFSTSLFSFKNIKKWQALLLSAEKVAANPAIVKRIMKERIGLDCVYIELSVKVPGWNTVDSKEVLNNEINKFQNAVDNLKLTRISDAIQDIKSFTLNLKQQNQ